MPISRKLNLLFTYIRNNNFTFTFSTCCSGRVPSEADMPDVIHIPSSHCQVDWEKQVDKNRVFFVEKAKTDIAQLKGPLFRDAMYGKFKNNANIQPFIKAIHAEEWVVTGNGAAYCVYPGIMSLLDAGQKITVLSNLLIDSAPGYSNESPYDLLMAMLDDVSKQGARVCSFEEWSRSECLVV
jgi:hypothetical protein